MLVIDPETLRHLVKRPLLVDDDFVLPGFKPTEWENALL